MRKSIKEFSNYEVDELGNVFSLSRPKYCGHNGSKPQILKETILKWRLNKKGYLGVVLYSNGYHKCYRLHRLVLETFNGAIPNGYEINHKNAVKTDNSLQNLELVTHVENMTHAVKNNLLPQKRIMPQDKINIYDLYIKSGYTQKEIANKYNIVQQTVSKIIRNTKLIDKLLFVDP